jgi:LacI family transcriptional regulator
MADIVYPPLTTLRISRRKYAELLYEALSSGEEDVTKPGKVLHLPMTMIVRQSTGPAPVQHHRSRSTDR